MSSIKEVIEWCDKQVAEGKTVVLKWDGGNDSGWVSLELDGEDIGYNNTAYPEANWLIDKMYDELDYGSWAGDFNATGEAPYNPETKTFEGVDYCSVDESDSTENVPAGKGAKFSIPDHFVFDSVEIHTQNENCYTQMALNGRNRLENPDESAYFDAESEKVKEGLIKLMDSDESARGREVCNFWHEYHFSKSDLVHDPVNKVYVGEILSVVYSFYDTEERGIMIDLSEMLENE